MKKVTKNLSSDSDRPLAPCLTEVADQNRLQQCFAKKTKGSDLCHLGDRQLREAVKEDRQKLHDNRLLTAPTFEFLSSQIQTQNFQDFQAQIATLVNSKAFANVCKLTKDERQEFAIFLSCCAVLYQQGKKKRSRFCWHAPIGKIHRYLQLKGIFSD